MKKFKIFPTCKPDVCFYETMPWFIIKKDSDKLQPEQEADPSDTVVERLLPLHPLSLSPTLLPLCLTQSENDSHHSAVLCSP